MKTLTVFSYCPFQHENLRVQIMSVCIFCTVVTCIPQSTWLLVLFRGCKKIISKIEFCIAFDVCCIDVLFHCVRLCVCCRIYTLLHSFGILGWFRFESGLSQVSAVIFLNRRLNYFRINYSFEKIAIFYYMNFSYHLTYNFRGTWHVLYVMLLWNHNWDDTTELLP